MPRQRKTIEPRKKMIVPYSETSIRAFIEKSLGRSNFIITDIVASVEGHVVTFACEADGDCMGFKDREQFHGHLVRFSDRSIQIGAATCAYFTIKINDKNVSFS